MDFLPAAIEKYVEATTTPESALLKEINRDTHLHVLKPRMLSGHLQGRVLSMFSHMIAPDRILEIGTYTGYGTLCMAEGLSDAGRITTIDINSEVEARTRRYFKEAGYENQIEFIIGDAIEILPTLKDQWDLVFIDADKLNYLNYYNLVFDNLKKGGFIIADNVLWSGKVVDNNISDKETEALREFNYAVNTDQRVENVLFPIRDGLMILRKI